MSNKITTLQKQATQIAFNLGHAQIEWFAAFPHNGGRGQNGRCRKCGQEVHIRTKPQPNEIDLGGAAIAQNCDVTYSATKKPRTPPKRHANRRKDSSQAALLQKYAEAQDAAKEALFHLCVKLYEQMATREDIAKLVREVRGVSHDDANVIATRLHRMSHDEYALDCLMHDGQEIAKRYTLRKSML